MSFFERLASLDRRVIYIVLALAVVIPVFWPLGLPTAEQDSAVRLYNAIADLPEGSVVVYSANFGRDSETSNLKPMSQVLIDLSLQKKHRIIIMTLWQEGCELLLDWTASIFDKHGAVYGEDYLVLGSFSSASIFLEHSRFDLHKACGGVDYKGNPLDSFIIADKLQKASDFSAAVALDVADPGYTIMVAQWGATSEVAIVACCLNEQPSNLWLLSTYYPRYGSLAVGSEGAAMLERLHGVLGYGHGYLDAQSLGVLAIIAFIILGNIGHLSQKVRHKKV